MTKPNTIKRPTTQLAAAPGPRRAAAPAAFLAGLLLAACGGRASGLDLATPTPEVSHSATPVATSPTPLATTSTPATTPAGTVPAQTDQQRVVAAYEAYYDLFQPLGEMPAAQRPAALAAVAIDPLYGAVLKELTDRDAVGKVSYGRIGTHPEVALLRGDAAAIRDCQNTTNAGLMNKVTGEKLTIGVPAYLRLSEMKRGADGAWRLTAINDYPKAKC